MTKHKVLSRVKIDDIEPEFMDGLAYCSCYTSTTGAKVGTCPHWVRYGDIYWCDIGCGVQNGGNGGKMCTPYFSRLIKACRDLHKLISAVEKGMVEQCVKDGSK